MLGRMGDRELGKGGGDIDMVGDGEEGIEGVGVLVGRERLEGVIYMHETSIGAAAAQRSEGLLLGEGSGCGDSFKA